MDEESTGTVFVVDDEEMLIPSLESYLQPETRHRVRTFVGPVPGAAWLGWAARPDTAGGAAEANE